MLDVLCPLVTECDTVSNELLNIILVNIVEPVKTSKKNAYHLAKELIVKCSETLEPYIQNVSVILDLFFRTLATYENILFQFFNLVLICGKEDLNLFISQKVKLIT
jgi:sister-chromatid-cohesion protein PDS5